jgi:outer membrane protein assembly factor BamB
VAGDTVLVPVLNGSLQARDRDDGRLLWTFRTQAAQANRDWVLSPDGRFNAGWLFTSSWGDATADGARRQQSVGSFFGTPLVVAGTVYIGSADSNVYACCSWAYNEMGLVGSIKEQTFEQMWFGDGQRWRASHDPRRDCRIHCLYETRN